ncbi:MAG: tetratricopeptide repeat protein [Aquincola tertiaricarbonis]
MQARSTLRFALAAAAWALLAAGAQAAEPTPAQKEALQARLEDAVRDHDQGRLEQAREAFEGLARAGVPAAGYNLAVMHLKRELPGASNSEALRLMTRAAEQGFVTATYGVARLYETGDAGRRDLDEAGRWYLRAAQQGSVDGQVEIATAYYLGRGAAKDLPAAAHWYREAAKGGDVGAQYIIASMYESGVGVAHDLRLARYWYAVAARGGDEVAPAKLREIDARLGTGSAPAPLTTRP